MNRELKYRASIIELKKKFESLPSADKLIFVKMVLTPDIKRQIFFSSIEDVRSVFQQEIGDDEREQLINETIRYAKGKK